MAKPKRPNTEYLEVSRPPLPSLAFLLPVIVLYELGTQLFARDPVTGAETRIIAFNFVSWLLQHIGTHWRFFPAVAVVILLLFVHVWQGDPWRFKPKVLGGMLAESACWAVPLLMLGLILARAMSLAGTLQVDPGTTEAATAARPSFAAMLVLSLGAGVYEELVFRLAAFALLSTVLDEMMGLKPRPVAIITVCTTAVAFSLYHYLGDEPFHLRTFIFRTLAGGFFGVLYLTRGFGVTAGAHVAYDVFVQFLSLT